MKNKMCRLYDKVYELEINDTQNMIWKLKTDYVDTQNEICELKTYYDNMQNEACELGDDYDNIQTLEIIRHKH